MLRNYFKIAFRSIVSNKAYSAINIAGLAIGLSCCLAIGLYMMDELSYDRFNKHFETIYRVTEKQMQADGNYTVAVTPGPLAPTLSKDFPQIMETTRVGLWSGVLGNEKQISESQSMLIIDPSFFKIFDFPLVVGNAAKVFQELTKSLSANPWHSVCSAPTGQKNQ
jgi:putative ABC transport system permease protein